MLGQESLGIGCDFFNGVLPPLEVSRCQVDEAVNQCQVDEVARIEMPSVEEYESRRPFDYIELRREYIADVDPNGTDNLQLYDPKLLQNLLAASKNQPADVRTILLKNLNSVEQLGPMRKLAIMPAGRVFEHVRHNFPNFAQVIDIIQRQVALSALGNIRSLELPPIFMFGPTGVGKTEFVKTVANALKTHSFEIHFSGLSAGFAIGGSDLSWSNGRPGQIFNELALGHVANPICLLDEIDKIAGSQRFSPAGHLYTLLESSTAKTFKDEAIPLPLDASRIQWFATANYPEWIEPALLSRFTQVEIQPPTREQSRVIIQNIYRSILDGAPWGKYFSTTVQDDVLDKIGSFPPRSLRRLLRDALGNAALARRDVLAVEDVRLERIKDAKVMGFY